MTKTKAPLFSFGARGSLGKTLTFQASPAGPRVISTPDHADANTWPQAKQRLLFLDAIDEWHALSDADKATYRSLGAAQNKTAYAYFMGRFLSGTLDGACRTLLPMLEGVGAAITDHSGYGNHGTIEGPAWTQYGDGPTVLYFNGDPDHVAIAYDSSLDITQHITVECLCYLDHAAGSFWYNVVCKGQSGQCYTLRLRSFGNTDQAKLLCALVDEVTDGNSYRNAWQYVVGTYDPVAELMRFYTNGILKAQETPAGPTQSLPDSMALGASHDLHNFFKGYLCYVRVLARTAQLPEIQRRYARFKHYLPGLALP